jgi:DNA-dependent protein kinase catalytic subunit
MELVYKLAPFINGIKETKEYFQLRLKTETEVYFLARFEGSAEKKDILKDSLCHFKTLPELGVDNYQLSYVQTWLAMLTAPLDCYTWIFGQKLLTPGDLFASKKSCVWLSLSYFVENVMNFELPELVRRVYHSGDPNAFIVCSPSETEEFKRAKCTAIVRLIDFLCTLVGNFPAEFSRTIPSSMWSDAFLKCVVNLCLDPQVVGFSLNDLEVYTNLPAKTKVFLKLFTQHAPPHILDRLKGVCKALIGDEKQEMQLIIKNLESSTERTKDASLSQG